MASKTLLKTLFALAADTSMSKKRRLLALEAIETHCKESKVKVPNEVGLIRTQIETTPNGGRSSSASTSVIGKRIVELLRETDENGFRKYSHKEIAAIVCRENPGAGTSDKSVASTLRDLEPAVKASIPARRPKSDKVKPAAIAVDVDGMEFEPEDDSDGSDDGEEGSDEE